jgi:hypothetical protein
MISVNFQNQKREISIKEKESPSIKKSPYKNQRRLRKELELN